MYMHGNAHPSCYVDLETFYCHVVQLFTHFGGASRPPPMIVKQGRPEVIVKDIVSLHEYGYRGLRRDHTMGACPAGVPTIPTFE